MPIGKINTGLLIDNLLYVNKLSCVHVQDDSNQELQPSLVHSEVVPCSSHSALLEQWTFAIPCEWIWQAEPGESVVRLCKLRNLPFGFCNQPSRVHICLTVNMEDGSWTVYAQDKQVKTVCAALQSFPAVLTPENLLEQLSFLGCLQICFGNPDDELMNVARKWKGVFKDVTGKAVKATIDSLPFVSGANSFSATIRTNNCEVLVSKEGRCSVCKQYRRTLLTMAARVKKSDVTRTGSHVNWQFLSTPEKAQRVTKRYIEVQ